MTSKIIVILLLFYIAVDSTTIKFKNYCPTDTVSVIETYDDPGLVCKLAPGTYCSKDYSTSGWRYFQNSPGSRGSILAAISIYYSGNNDRVELHTHTGFDLPLQIASRGSALTCSTSDCADSYDFNSSKYLSLNTGGVITVIWCPSNFQVGGKELKLIEAIHNSSSINLKPKSPAVWSKHLDNKNPK